MSSLISGSDGNGNGDMKKNKKRQIATTATKTTTLTTRGTSSCSKHEKPPVDKEEADKSETAILERNKKNGDAVMTEFLQRMAALDREIRQGRSDVNVVESNGNGVTVYNLKAHEFFLKQGISVEMADLLAYLSSEGYAYMNHENLSSDLVTLFVQRLGPHATSMDFRPDGPRHGFLRQAMQEMIQNDGVSQQDVTLFFANFGVLSILHMAYRQYVIDSDKNDDDDKKAMTRDDFRTLVLQYLDQSFDRFMGGYKPREPPLDLNMLSQKEIDTVILSLLQPTQQLTLNLLQHAFYLAARVPEDMEPQLPPLPTTLLMAQALLLGIVVEDSQVLLSGNLGLALRSYLILAALVQVVGDTNASSSSSTSASASNSTPSTALSRLTRRELEYAARLAVVSVPEVEDAIQHFRTLEDKLKTWQQEYRNETTQSTVQEHLLLLSSSSSSSNNKPQYQKILEAFASSMAVSSTTADHQQQQPQQEFHLGHVDKIVQQLLSSDYKDTVVIKEDDNNNNNNNNNTDDDDDETRQQQRIQKELKYVQHVVRSMADTLWEPKMTLAQLLALTDRDKERVLAWMASSGVVVVGGGGSSGDDDDNDNDDRSHRGALERLEDEILNLCILLGALPLQPPPPQGSSSSS